MWNFAKVTSVKNAVFAVFQFLVVFAEFTFTFEQPKFHKKIYKNSLTNHGSRAIVLIR
nr:MAG TPA: hypothetical protein [Bacteriophage sp.]